MSRENQYTFIDLFAGIGGFHQAFHKEGAKCVFVSEWDEFARKTYFENYKKISPEIFEERVGDDGKIQQSLFAGDITKVDVKDILAALVGQEWRPARVKTLPVAGVP